MSDLMASHKVMRHYLNALLTEEVETKPKSNSIEKQQLSALLATIPIESAGKVNKPAVQTAALLSKHSTASSVTDSSYFNPEKKQETVTKSTEKQIHAQPLQVNVTNDKLNNVVSLPDRATPLPRVAKALTSAKEYRQGKFQALFFEVAGLKVALPLKELGGIHKILPLNTLPSKPQWYRGVMLYRDQKINVVDTARWVMPEKYDDKLEETLNYQYVIMLGKSSWGLACETLVNTVTLEQDDVKWRSTEGKRPWLAGLIKQHMCALLDVDAMVALLAQGAGSSD